jgi:hypothetical protein
MTFEELHDGEIFTNNTNGIPPKWIETLDKYETISDIAKGVFASSKNP